MAKEKNKGGRPKEWTQDRIDALRAKLEKWLEKPGNVFLKQFASDMKLHRGTLDDLTKKCPKFYDTYREGMAKQEAWMWKQGFHGKNYQFTKWALCTLHGYKEKPDETKSATELIAEALAQVVKTKDFSKGEAKDETTEQSEK